MALSVLLDLTILLRAIREAEIMNWHASDEHAFRQEEIGTTFETVRAISLYDSDFLVTIRVTLYDVIQVYLRGLSDTAVYVIRFNL